MPSRACVCCQTPMIRTSGFGLLELLPTAERSANGSMPASWPRVKPPTTPSSRGLQFLLGRHPAAFSDTDAGGSGDGVTERHHSPYKLGYRCGKFAAAVSRITCRTRGVAVNGLAFRLTISISAQGCATKARTTQLRPARSEAGLAGRAGSPRPGGPPRFRCRGGSRSPPLSVWSIFQLPPVHLVSIRGS